MVGAQGGFEVGGLGGGGGPEPRHPAASDPGVEASDLTRIEVGQRALVVQSETEVVGHCGTERAAGEVGVALEGVAADAGSEATLADGPTQVDRDAPAEPDVGAGAAGQRGAGQFVGPHPLGGRIGHGGIGSLASVVKAALGASRLTTLVVTDRRLAVAADSGTKVRVEGLDQEVAIAELLASVPRSLVLGVRRRRRPLEWGRIELAFVDGSSITVTSGVISGRRADQLVASLTS